jgi:hypothetical protein
MPDFGGLGRGIAKRAKEASQQAAAKVSPSEIAEEAARLQTLLASRRPEPGPVVGQWEIGIGNLLAEHPRTPGMLHGLVRQLNRYGGLAIAEQTLAIDGEEIEWDAVEEIRTRNIVEYLLSDAVGSQIERLPLPWFPGRGKLLDVLGNGLMTLVIAAADEQLAHPDVDIRIPAEVEYRKRGRRRDELHPGVLASLVLADPAVRSCLEATAQTHGVAVVASDDEDVQAVAQRAEKLRGQLASLKALVADRGKSASEA